eukprot:CAMPEP_0198212158 /NCGR_PEP_ID=MMETSP1445-20131203/25554_1 /TAXON_ID=36898 /ORGANISM="Pyramimonas sp., Strain CCMP2087" /LENGTH=264 /DNA_ID=CAMNT_0043886547 /DNA_START=205 /DNA_END=999 /DNA_ORIENTATION=+
MCPNTTIARGSYEIRPYEALADLVAGPGERLKVVHFVRHGQGTHNVEGDYRSMQHFDAALTPYGIEQCEALAVKTSLLSKVDLLVTSPLTRCIQTASIGFPKQQQAGVPFIALESVRETVNFSCDRRRSIREVAKNFPTVDFSQTEDDEDSVWGKYEKLFGDQEAYDKERESDDHLAVAERARTFFAWFGDRAEQEVLVSTHSAFLHHLFNHAQPGYVAYNRTEAFGGDVATVVHTTGNDAFEKHMRARWENCELRSMVIVYDS